jgi:hypothetical protein
MSVPSGLSLGDLQSKQEELDFPKSSAMALAARPYLAVGHINQYVLTREACR